MNNNKKIINELLVNIFNHILSVEQKALKREGVSLSMTEVHVLDAIKDSACATMSSVAKRLRITLGTLTTSINVLVKKEFVNRIKDIKDRRKIHLGLTQKAEKVLEIHHKFHEEMVDSLFFEMKIDQDEVLMRALANISEYFKSKY